MPEKFVLTVERTEELGNHLGWKVILRFEHTGSALGDFSGTYVYQCLREGVTAEQAQREAKLEFIEYIARLSTQLQAYRQKI